MATESAVRSGVMRVTAPTLDVLRALLADTGSELHGWAICNTTGRSGPTVYKILERLEDRGLATSRWEESARTVGKPPRRFYRLTPAGVDQARSMLAGQRPATSYQKK